MEFKQDNWWPVSGFKEWQDLSIQFWAEGNENHTFGIVVEGDIVIDDGWLHCAVNRVDLDLEKAKELHKELGDWIDREGNRQDDPGP